MADIKRHPHPRSHHRMKARRRKPNIPQLVYQFLRNAYDRNREESPSYTNICNFCNLQKQPGKVSNSGNKHRKNSRRMANKRRNTTRIPKSPSVKHHRTPKSQHLSGCMRKRSGEDVKIVRHGIPGLSKVKKYIQKALDFGVESGYLIPKDSTYRVLRVSSDLISRKVNNLKTKSFEGTVSNGRERTPRRTPARFEDYQVQEARRRRRRRGRRSRSGSKRRRRRSRRRRRRRSMSDNPEEAAGNDDYEDDLENTDEKKDGHKDDVDRDTENSRKNDMDDEKSGEKRNEDHSYVYMDDDDSYDEEERKRDDPTKS